MKCKKCGSQEFRKNGKRKGKIQRFRCKNCDWSYSNHKIIYTKTEKRLLSFLINFLETDLEGKDIKKLLFKSKEYRSGISNIQIGQCRKDETYVQENKLTSYCPKPRLIICEDNNKIKLIKIPAEVSEKYTFSFNLSLR